MGDECVIEFWRGIGWEVSVADDALEGEGEHESEREILGREKEEVAFEGWGGEGSEDEDLDAWLAGRAMCKICARTFVFRGSLSK